MLDAEQAFTRGSATTFSRRRARSGIVAFIGRKAITKIVRAIIARLCSRASPYLGLFAAGGA
jgi:hypothetical protein